MPCTLAEVYQGPIDAEPSAYGIRGFVLVLTDQITDMDPGAFVRRALRLCLAALT